MTRLEGCDWQNGMAPYIGIFCGVLNLTENGSTNYGSLMLLHGTHIVKLLINHIKHFCMPMTQHYFDVCTAHGTGDPHYRAVTGRRFDFHGDGEFLLLEIGPERSQIQGIVSRLRRSRRGAAVHRSFAFGEPGRFAYQVSLVFLPLRNS